MRVVLEHDRCVLFHGDSAKLGDVLAENSLDSMVIDPPAGIGFMSKEWDEDKGGRDEWVAWLGALLVPAYRALKPGAWGLVWALPRTSHWTAWACEEAGFEVRDVHHHIFGTGMPKSVDLARQIDMHLCELPGRHYDKNLPATSKRRDGDHLCPHHPRREEAQAMRTALKPAVEHWLLVQKPREGKYAENVLKYGTGGLNIEGCRPGHNGAPPTNVYSGAKGTGGAVNETVYGHSGKYLYTPDDAGRWPAHLSLEHADTCGERCVLGCPVRILDEQSGVTRSTKAKLVTLRQDDDNIAYGHGFGNVTPDNTYSDAGGASRFFYVAKPARSEKDAGLDHLTPKSGGEATGREEGSVGTKNPRAGAGRTGGARNHHPTVKSVALMRWLVRLVTPPGGVVLDVFAGSGTTGIAAIEEGLSFVGCELTDEYVPIVEGRLRHALAEYEAAAAGGTAETSVTPEETPP